MLSPAWQLVKGTPPIRMSMPMHRHSEYAVHGWASTTVKLEPEPPGTRTHPQRAARRSNRGSRRAPCPPSPANSAATPAHPTPPRPGTCTPDRRAERGRRLGVLPRARRRPGVVVGDVGRAPPTPLPVSPRARPTGRVPQGPACRSRGPRDRAGRSIRRPEQPRGVDRAVQSRRYPRTGQTHQCVRRTGHEDQHGECREAGRTHPFDANAPGHGGEPNKGEAIDDVPEPPGCGR